MPLVDYVHPSGNRIHAGESGLLYHGTGRLYVLHAPIRGIDANLWGALKWVADNLAVSLWITSIDTGGHVPGSRHYDGRAADLGGVAPVGSAFRVATLANPHAVKVARLFLANGWRVGEGPPPAPGLLFGPVHTAMNTTDIDHRTHIHSSLPRGLRPGEEEEDPESVCEVAEAPPQPERIVPPLRPQLASMIPAGGR